MPGPGWVVAAQPQGDAQPKMGLLPPSSTSDGKGLTASLATGIREARSCHAIAGFRRQVTSRIKGNTFVLALQLPQLHGGCWTGRPVELGEN